VNGKDYYFRTREEFEEGIRKGEFLESATIFGNLYGTPRKSIEAAMAEGKKVVVDIDSQGARSVRALHWDACFVFIAPPSLEELRQRLVHRKTESPEVVQRRLQAAESEIAQSGSYDFVVTNRTVEQTVKEIEIELRKRKIL
jgi:guanylate kinase